MSLLFATRQCGGKLTESPRKSGFPRVLRVGSSLRGGLVAAGLVLLLAPAGATGKEPRLALESETRSPVTLYEIGVSRLVLGDLEGAETSFRLSLGRATAIGIDFAPPHEGIARLLLARGKLDAARFEALAAIELDRTWTPAYLVLGKIEEREGNPETALAHYQRGLVLDPVNDDLSAAAVELLRKMDRDREATDLEERVRRLRARAAVSAPTATPGGAPQLPASTAPAAPAEAPPVDSLTAATRTALRPFFPEVVEKLSPRLLAVFQQPRLTRGALAVLAVGDGDHGIGRLFERSAGSRDGADQPPEDTRGRPEERWIHRALAGGVLETLPDNTFQPDQSLTRAALALWVEEMVERVRRDPGVFSLYRGQPSPFSDIPADHYALNAARLVTDLKLLPPVAASRFGLDDPVSVSEGIRLLERMGVLFAEPAPPADAEPATGPR